ncbi:MAG: type III ribulose-bisphosphate carboxylase [Candidatus Micrarchaeota archaeon]
MAYEGYVNLKYKPGKDDLVCYFYLEPAQGKSVSDAAAATAAESSIGTWTDVSTTTKRIARMRAQVFDIKKNMIKVSYPADLFEGGNMPEILSSIAGNVFGMKEVENLRLTDIDFPDSILKSFKGPAHGIEGVRKYLGVKKRPLTGTIVKPKLGLNAKEHAQVAYEAWSGGLDIVKDDENLTGQKFNPFNERVSLTLKMLDKAERETGERKGYMANVTAETQEMLKRMDFVRDCGGKYIMFDVVTGGWSALQTLRDNSNGLIVHAHRAMHGALTRNKRHGISMMALAKTYRLIGVDQLHTGTVVGKMEGSAGEVTAINKAITGKMGDIKPVFPVASGGLCPTHVPDLVNILGKDVIIQAGGGVHGHPKGTAAGAAAMRQAVDAAMDRIPLKEYAKTHEELRSALKKWG